MSYETPGLGEDFSARVIFKLDGPIPLRWAVTHELSTNIGGDSTALDTAAAQIESFHVRMLLEPYQVEKVVLSTLAADSHPYDPTTFKVFDFNAFGTRSAGDNDVYDLNNVLVVNRTVSFGRLGHMFLRGTLHEGDVSSTGGRVALNDAAALNTELQSAVTASGIGSLLSGTATDVQLYMIRPGLVDNEERAISGFQVSRLGQKKLNNKWFNRS